MPRYRAFTGLMLLAALAACGGSAPTQEAAVFDEIGEELAAPTPNVDCGDESVKDCDQAVSAIVNGLPAGDEVVSIELRPVDEGQSVPSEAAWSASASVTMENRFVYELVIVQEMRPGPMAIDFAVER